MATLARTRKEGVGVGEAPEGREDADGEDAHALKRSIGLQLPQSFFPP